MAFIFSVLKNIGRRSSRNALTVLSVCIGVFALLLISTASDTGSNLLYSELDSMGLSGLSVSGDESLKPLDDYDLSVIKEISGVSSATPIMISNCNIESKGIGGKSIGWGIDSGSEQIISIEIVNGRLFSKSEVENNSYVCILDTETASSVFGRTNVAGESIFININGAYMQYEIVGVAKAGSNLLGSVVADYLPYVVYLPYTTIQNETGNRFFSQIAINTDSKADSEAVKERIVDVLQGNYGDDAIKCENLSGQRQRLESIVLIIKVLLSVIGAISLVVAGIGNTTAMISSVRERTKEIGIKKSIGASGGKIILEFLIESVLISLIGCIIGISVFVLVIFVLSTVFMPIVISTSTVISIMCLTIFVGIISGVYPAVKASNLRPVDALNQQI